MNSPQIEISRELDPGERILWADKPKQGVFLRQSDFFLIPFSLVWAGFAISWEIGAIISGAPLLFIIWGIPFVIVGFYITIGRFIVDTKVRSKTFYGLTDKRIIIVSGIRTRQVKSLSLQTLTDVSLQEYSNGSGTITFGSSNPYTFEQSGLHWPGVQENTTPCFELINNAKQVYRQIRKAQEER